MQAKRVELVDALRGYALFGLLLVHCYERFEIYWLDPNPDIWVQTVAGLFGGKAYAIFALLFGFSFATIMFFKPSLQIGSKANVELTIFLAVKNVYVMHVPWFSALNPSWFRVEYMLSRILPRTA